MSDDPTTSFAITQSGNASRFSAPSPTTPNHAPLKTTPDDAPLQTTPDEAIRDAEINARRALLAARSAEHFWAGRLSSSAVATSTAVFALWLTNGKQSCALVKNGIQWLCRHQNEDGGWGDSTDSPSNLSATLLTWAALASAQKQNPDVPKAVEAAEVWLKAELGGVKPEHIRAGLRARYGQDETFVIPIFAMCTLAERLGEGAQAWAHVKQLPYEIAMLPRGILKGLNLGVVSFAFPALIAVGLVRHHAQPSRSIVLRHLRNGCERRLLRYARSMQPSSGGYQEAIPLTAFVSMCLYAAGHEQDPVVEDGVRFLRRSVQQDGSWQIDLSLSTWLTALSVRALAASSPTSEVLSEEERLSIRKWLLSLQLDHQHEMTHAAPGGWPWTHLPGGMPDADDTSRVLLALKDLGAVDPATRDQAMRGVAWLMDLQNRDGGIPTFSRGWGFLPFDRSCHEITAMAILAMLEWKTCAGVGLSRRIERSIDKGLRFLQAAQSATGAWPALWFGAQKAPQEKNLTYGTACVLTALDQARGHPRQSACDEMCERAERFLLGAQNGDGGWGPVHNVASSIEETAVAVAALAARPSARASVKRGAHWLVVNTNAGRVFKAKPIGLYFARLWYAEELYPLVFTVEALSKTVRALSR